MGLHRMVFETGSISTRKAVVQSMRLLRMGVFTFWGRKFLLGFKYHLERRMIHFNLHFKIDRCLESEVFVIPFHGGVAVSFGERSRNHFGVFVSLNDFKSGIQRCIVKGIRQLTKSPAHIGHNASLPNFTSHDKTLIYIGISEVFPEAKYLIGFNFESVKFLGCNSQVFNFPGGENPIQLVVIGVPKFTLRRGNHLRRRFPKFTL